MMSGLTKGVLAASALAALVASGCSKPLGWPASPLYATPAPYAADAVPIDRQSALAAIAGHYAHFDVVAYEDLSTSTPMRTFVVSYGFTDFEVRDGRLFQTDSFCHAEHKINQKGIRSTFQDASVQAIKPRVAEVGLRPEGGQWYLYRPETPTLLGISGDPSLPLSRDRRDPRLTDPDGDGHPGVTVGIVIGGLIKGEIYITRREIYSTRARLNGDGSITGQVVDRSEQFVVDASLAILRQPSNSMQFADPGLNPLILVPIDPSIDTWDELKAIRDGLFPPEPGFVGPRG